MPGARMVTLAFMLVIFSPRLGSAQELIESQFTQNHVQTTVFDSCFDSVASLGYYNGSLGVTYSGSECLKWTEFPDYIQQYQSRGLGDHNYCRNPDGASMPWCFYRHATGMISWAHCDCSHGAVRLTGGQSKSEGRVELYYNGIWGTICNEQWTDADASVVCRQLGFSEIGRALKYGDFDYQLAPVNLHSVDCRGDENTLLQCSTSKVVVGDCTHGRTAAVTCKPPEGLETPLRLVGGKERFEGRVEVYHDGHWGTICDDHWDDRDAEVVCRLLGLSGKPKAWLWAHYGHGSGPIFLDEVECTGNELSLDQCKKSNWGHHNCDHIEDAGVSCDPFKEGAVRLSGGSHLGEGRVEVYYNMDWGTVCDDSWTEFSAQVVCRQLGFSGPSSVASEGEFGSGDGFILLDDVACTGLETSLLDCPHSRWGQHDCSHAEDVGIHCSNESNYVAGGPSAAGPLVRLVDGESAMEGRVEIFLNGEWGSVCDDGWTDQEAAVVCKQLGFRGPAKARLMAFFGEGQGPIHLDNVECSGTENTLIECVKQDQGIHNCWHNEDAGAICDFVEEKAYGFKSTGAMSAMCGQRLLHRRRKRIIGGIKSIRGGWPWQASLRLKEVHKETRLLCGATLISNCWALTAAHCFKRFGVNAHHYAIRVGDYHTGVEDEFERELAVERIVLHRNYRSKSNDNDIALIKMKSINGQCLLFTHHVLPICLPQKKETSLAKQACFISGWGDTVHLSCALKLICSIKETRSLKEAGCATRANSSFKSSLRPRR
ncbi:neurotrypsin-like isoform X2 [Ambystoma mexicanum]|uniref:neurotrypsin-like isoform X2 n=1 Tax=Ambystoma mexicanum TaxID=8296 RepID=UPI0037E76C36